MKSLEDKEWKDFIINDLFEVSGSFTTHPSKLVEGGRTPRITCSSINNGLDNLYLNSPTETGGVLTVDSATIGHISYQETDFIATDHVEKISIKQEKINRDLGLGLTASIRTSVLDKFNYGYKFSQKRIKKQKILLPVNKEESPDYEYMEQYTKSIIDKKIENYKRYAKKLLSQLEYKEIEPLDNKEWKEFFLSGENGLFENFHGKRLIKEKRIKGNTPLLTAGEQNNGLADFISNTDMKVFENCISIDMFGNSFYHNYNCTGDDNIYFFINEQLSKYVKLFIIELINKNKNKFSYGKQFRQKHADSLKIMLPINKNNEPDFEYMEQYIKNIMYKKINQYLNHLEKNKFYSKNKTIVT